MSKFPWHSVKFPDNSLTLRNFISPWHFPDGYEPWSISENPYRLSIEIFISIYIAYIDNLRQHYHQSCWKMKEIPKVVRKLSHEQKSAAAYGPVQKHTVNPSIPGWLNQYCTSGVKIKEVSPLERTSQEDGWVHHRAGWHDSQTPWNRQIKTIMIQHKNGCKLLHMPVMYNILIKLYIQGSTLSFVRPSRTGKNFEKLLLGQVVHVLWWHLSDRTGQ